MPGVTNTTYINTLLADHKTPPYRVETRLTADREALRYTSGYYCFFLSLCEFESLHCLLSQLHAFDGSLFLLVCVVYAAEGSNNNDITSDSINLSVPPTGKGVVGAQRRKQGCHK